MSEAERKKVIRRVSVRILNNLNRLEGFTKLDYMQRFVSLLDDQQIAAIDFGLIASGESIPAEENNNPIAWSVDDGASESDLEVAFGDPD